MDPNESVRLFLEEIVASGEETGLQVAAYHHGRLVIDAWSQAASSESVRAELRKIAESIQIEP